MNAGMSGKRFLQSVENYVSVCVDKERIPNRAGYLRYMRLTREKYDELCRKNSEEAELIDSIFEDEALNANTKKISSSVLNLYMKERFGYGSGEETGGEVNVICSHGDYE